MNSTKYAPDTFKRYINRIDDICQEDPLLITPLDELRYLLPQYNCLFFLDTSDEETRDIMDSVGFGLRGNKISKLLLFSRFERGHSTEAYDLDGHTMYYSALEKPIKGSLIKSPIVNGAVTYGNEASNDILSKFTVRSGLMLFPAFARYSKIAPEEMELFKGVYVEDEIVSVKGSEYTLDYLIKRDNGFNRRFTNGVLNFMKEIRNRDIPAVYGHGNIHQILAYNNLDI